MPKITIKSCTEKKKTDKYTIYEVIDADDNKYDSFEDLKHGETIEVEVTPNDPYNARIKVKKATKPFVTKDTKRETALMCAVRTVGNEYDDDASKSNATITIAEKYLNWLNQK